MKVTTFASGSGGNCTLVSMEGAHFLIDAGISFKRIREHLSVFGLKPDALTAVLITHEHSDHIGGLATMVKYTETPVLAPRTVANRLRYAVPGVERNLREFPVGEDVPLEGVTVRAFHTPHDTDESVGWRLTGEQVFALSTDMGHVTDEIRAGLTGADVALIEANHDVELLRAGPYPYYLKKRILSDCGHLSNDDCAVLAAALAGSGTETIILGHLSRENNTPEIALRAVSAALVGVPDCRTGLYVAPPAERLSVVTERKAVCSA